MAKVGGKTIASMARPSNTRAQAQKAPATPVQTAKAPETPVEAKTENKGQQAPETPKKEVKMPEPKAWQRLDVSDPNKPKLVNQITFLGEKMDYEPGFKAEYEWHNLDNADGLRRVVTAKFPKSNKPDSTDIVDFMGYKLTINKYGNSAVCKLEGPWQDEEGNPIKNAVILEYVSLATVLDVLQDLLNPKDANGNGTCTIPWGTIDQVIKKKRGLKSRIKHLGDNDLPARSQRGRKSEAQAEEQGAEDSAKA